MTGVRNFLKYWLPVLVWMAVIFSASSDSKSSQHSSRILAPILHWLFPHISDDTADSIVFGARKCAHLTEYGILALLLWRAIRKPFRNDPRPWDWPQVRMVLLLLAFYAATDEFHQVFVPTREARVHDVVIDTTGGALALLVLWYFGFYRTGSIRTAQE